MVNSAPKRPAFLWSLLPCAGVLCLAAWLRGAEYDEQYTLFLTAGVPRPDWPAAVFTAGLARQLQAGHAGLSGIAHNLRVTDVHPPLYFWLVALWRDVFGPSLFVARLLSVLLGLGSLALVGIIARIARLPPVPAMLFTLGCYGFTYTSVVARGFALAELLVLGGVACVLAGRRVWHFAVAGMLFGAATLTNYLAVFVALAGLLALGVPALRSSTALRVVPAAASVTGFLLFIPADLWWFLAQRGSRLDQFPPFALTQSLTRLAVRFTGDILGGLPLYVAGTPSMLLTAALGLFLIWLGGCVIRSWPRIGTPLARWLFAMAAVAPAGGLLILGAIFNNTPIEVRYLTFATPFVGLLLAGAVGWRSAALLLAVQGASLAGLMLAPQTMQPARAAASAAASWVDDGVVLLPRGNDGVGVVGAFAIEAPPNLPLLLIPALASPAQIRAGIRPWHRVVLALLQQDAASRAASTAMRQALTDPGWRLVAFAPNLAVYQRTAEGNPP